MKKTNEYLYGEGVEVPLIPQEIVEARVIALQKHLSKLLDHSYYTRNGKRCNDIIHAISFWENINKKEI